MSKKTIAFAIMGEEDTGKSTFACGMAERVLYVGKRKHMQKVESMLGYALTHVEDFLPDLMARLKEESGDPNWRPPSVTGYHLGAWEIITDELQKPEIHAQLVELFDLIVFDECTHGLDLTFKLWKEDAADFVKRKQTAIDKMIRDKNGEGLKRVKAKTHPFVSNENKVNTQAMYLSLKVDPPLVFQKAEALGINVGTVWHVRPKEGSRGVYLRGPSRTCEQQLTELFQTIIYVGKDPNRFVDGFSRPNQIFAPFFYHQNTDDEYRTKDKEAIIAGYMLANMWAYAYSAGVRVRDGIGRNGVNALAVGFADYFQANNITEPRAQAIHVWSALKDESSFAHPKCNKLQAVRVIYQRAAALAQYEAEKNADPFDFPLPGSTESLKSLASGGEKTSKNLASASIDW